MRGSPTNPRGACLAGCAADASRLSGTAETVPANQPQRLALLKMQTGPLAFIGMNEWILNIRRCMPSCHLPMPCVILPLHAFAHHYMGLVASKHTKTAHVRRRQISRSRACGLLSPALPRRGACCRGGTAGRSWRTAGRAPGSPARPCVRKNGAPNTHMSSRLGMGHRAAIPLEAAQHIQRAAAWARMGHPLLRGSCATAKFHHVQQGCAHLTWMVEASSLPTVAAPVSPMRGRPPAAWQWRVRGEFLV